jgi:hypothetical protein
MVCGNSALGFRPNAPATGHPVCTLVTPTLPNGSSYPFSFQYISRPSFSSWLNGNPSIFFRFIRLQATSSPTGGHIPIPCPESSPRRASASSSGYLLLRSQKPLKYRGFRPGRMPVSRPSRVTTHQSRVTVLLRSANARDARGAFFMGRGPFLRQPPPATFL